MEKEYWNSILIILIYILYRFLTTLLETSNLSCFSGGYYVQAFSCGDRLRQLQMKQETCTGLHVNRLDNFFQVINVRIIILIQHYTDDENSAQTNHCECLSSLCYRPISKSILYVCPDISYCISPLWAMLQIFVRYLIFQFSHIQIFSLVILLFTFPQFIFLKNWHRFNVIVTTAFKPYYSHIVHIMI